MSTGPVFRCPRCHRVPHLCSRPDRQLVTAGGVLLSCGAGHVWRSSHRDAYALAGVSYTPRPR